MRVRAVRISVNAIKNVVKLIFLLCPWRVHRKEASVWLRLTCEIPSKLERKPRILEIIVPRGITVPLETGGT